MRGTLISRKTIAAISAISTTNKPAATPNSACSDEDRHAADDARARGRREQRDAEQQCEAERDNSGDLEVPDASRRLACVERVPLIADFPLDRPSPVRRSARPADLQRKRRTGGPVPNPTIVVLEGDQTGQELLVEALRVSRPTSSGSTSRSSTSISRSTSGARRTTRSCYEAAAAMKRTKLGLKAATITPEAAAATSVRRTRSCGGDRRQGDRADRPPHPRRAPGGRHPRADLGRADGGRRRLRRQGMARDRRTATRSPIAPNASSARSAGWSPSTRSSTRGAPALRCSAARSTPSARSTKACSRKRWTPRRALSRRPVRAAADRCDLRAADLDRRRSAGHPVTQPRRRLPLRPRHAALRLDRRRRVDADVVHAPT